MDGYAVKVVNQLLDVVIENLRKKKNQHLMVEVMWAKERIVELDNKGRHEEKEYRVSEAEVNHFYSVLIGEEEINDAFKNYLGMDIYRVSIYRDCIVVTVDKQIEISPSNYPPEVIIRYINVLTGDKHE
jgi:hypothetical protein